MKPKEREKLELCYPASESLTRSCVRGARREGEIQHRRTSDGRAVRKSLTIGGHRGVHESLQALRDRSGLGAADGREDGVQARLECEE